VFSADYSPRHGADAPVQVEAVPAAKELSGRVVDAAGNPVADAQVALSTETTGVLVSHGKLEPMWGNVAESRIVQTDSQGTFVLGQHPPESFDLIVAHDKGFASIGSDEFIDSNEIRLRPWGRIEGQLAKGRHASENKIWMAGSPNSTWFLHKRDYRYETVCDSDGHFVFEKVPAGWFEAGYLIRIGEMGASITSRTPVEVEPGETAKITLGGSGRPVVGKFVPPEGYDKSIYFGNGLRSLDRTRPDEPRPENYDRMTRREREQWRVQWRKSDEYKLYRDSYWHDPNWRQYTFRINHDGSFRIEDVIAGKYDFTVWIEERLTGGQRPEEIASYYGTIEVPEMPGGRSDEPLDLGELELTMHDPLRVGDMAPLFEAKTLDGKDLKLIDSRGKFILLSFWQPVSHPERQQLRELYDAYSLDGRLEIIGLGGHDTREEVMKYVEENDIPWPQIFVGEEFKSGIAKDYRIPGVPWIFLVGPDGKIIAKGLRGEELTPAVRGALEP
jgi:peroxiredoxin